MVEVFRTNLDTEEQADFILANLGRAFPDCKVDLDLDEGVVVKMVYND